MRLYNMVMKVEVSPAQKYYEKDFFNDERLKLKVLHMETSNEYPSHSHDFYELVFVYSGKGIHLLGAKEQEISPGYIIFIPIGREHSYIKSKNLSYINIVFSEDLIENTHINPEEFLLTKITEYDMTKLIDVINQIDRETFRKEYGYESNAKALFETVLINIVRAVKRNDYLRSQNAEQRVRSVVENINKNLSLSYTLNEVAEMANTSPRNFSRIFKQLYNTTVFKYINESRIKESLPLLKNTEMTVIQIASLVGFDDSSYYSSTFKTQMGESPSEYRNRNPN